MPTKSCGPWRQSDRMTMSQFAEYYKDSYPQAFIIEHIGDLQGHDLRKGQRVIACHERKVRVLQANVLKEDGRTHPVTIPINLCVKFALLPAQNSQRFWGCKDLSVEDIVHSKDGIPKAVQVMVACTNSKKQPVPPNEVLFDVTVKSKIWGKSSFKATSANGVPHTFNEGDTTARFSSRLDDNKALPVKFYDHITFPQKARVYLTEGQECQVEGLEHLCVVEFTRRHEQSFVAIKTNIDDPESHECQSVPFDLDMLVSAVTLKDCLLENNTLKDRKMIKQLSATNILQPSSGNLYVSEPIDTTIRDEPDPPTLCNPAPPGSRRESQISVGRSQSLRVHIYYNCMPETTEEASSPQARRGSIGESQDYAYVQVHFPTQGQPSSPPSSNPLPSSPPPSSRSPSGPPPSSPPPSNPQPSSPPPSSPPPSGPPPSGPPPSGPPSSGPPDPPPKPARLKRVSYTTQPRPVMPRPQKATSGDEDAYEKMDVEDNSPRQRVEKMGWKLPQPPTSRPSPSVVAAQSDGSPKVKPKGVPSMGTPSAPMRAPPSPRVHRAPITLTSRPKEPELRYHVAAKLGQDWRPVCTYLGLQHYQLEQADGAHSRLEDKAMGALVMWLRGQGESRAPPTWNTLLQALRRAGQNDMASDVEKHINSGKLEVQLIASMR